LNRRLSLCLAAPVLGLAGCVTTPTQLAQDAVVIDTHIDVPFRLERKPQDVSVSTPDGDFDYPRARAGGLDAMFMSIYIPASVDENGGAGVLANKLIDGVEDLERLHPDKFAVATCAADILAQKRRGLVSMPMGMENGGPVAGEVQNLQHFYQRGIRYITLTHSKANHISDSSYDDFRRWQGLSSFGRKLIKAMNDTGVMIDVSHISDDAFWQVLDLSAVPVIATHSSMRHFTPGFERNMSDEMVAALGSAGGVIQINYGSGFLTDEARAWSTELQREALAYAFNNDIPQNDPRLLAFMQGYREDHPYPYATLEDVLDHIDRAVEAAGIDAVGIGSDYDGVDDTLPVGLEDVASYPNLIAGLRTRGYDDGDITKILGDNTLRVWRAAERHAAAQGNPPRCRG